MASELHIITRGNLWVVKKETALKAIKICPTLEFAINYTLPYLLEKHNIVVHDRTGNVSFCIYHDSIKKAK